MMTLSYDEAVHTYIGLTLITVAGVGAFFVDRPDAPRWRQHAWLVLALFLGWIVMGSNESFDPPANGNVWWEPIKHLVTMSGNNTWWGAIQTPHVLQHKIAALCIITPALTEWFIRRRPDHPATRYLRWILPLALAGVAVVFVIHRPMHRHGGMAGMPGMSGMTPEAMQSELYQHWVFAAAFAAGAIAALTSRLGRPITVPPRAWYAFLALGGLVFVTFRV